MSWVAVDVAAVAAGEVQVNIKELKKAGYTLLQEPGEVVVSIQILILSDPREKNKNKVNMI